MPEWMNPIVLVVAGVIVIIGKDVIDKQRKKKRNGNVFCDLHDTMIKDIVKSKLDISELRQDMTEVKTDVKWIVKKLDN